nr:hypothetical protein [Trifolium medium]
HDVMYLAGGDYGGGSGLGLSEKTEEF